MLKTTKLILSAQNSRFNQNSYVEPIQTYIDKTKLEIIAYIKTQNINNNLSALEIRSLRDLNSRKDIIIKKTDKNNMCVIMHKSDYIKEGERQLNSKYYSNQPILSYTIL
jgi:vacuolar-type H+-ATPase subunit I/STV1